MIETTRREESDPSISSIGAVIRYTWHEHFQEFCPEDTWSPAINMYRLSRRLEMCVDLAGVEPQSLDVRVEPGRLTIRGVRVAPEPPLRAGEEMHIVVMEIDHGPFRRNILLPEQVDLTRVQTQYSKGILWISLPLLEQG
jgi:HSP20 family protein